MEDAGDGETRRRGDEETDCHTSDVGHWLAMTGEGSPCGSTRTLSFYGHCEEARRADVAIRTPGRSACFAPEEEEQRSEQALPRCGGARDAELAPTRTGQNIFFIAVISFLW